MRARTHTHTGRVPSYINTANPQVLLQHIISTVLFPQTPEELLLLLAIISAIFEGRLYAIPKDLLLFP